MSPTVWRGLLAGLVICLCTASAVSATVLLLVADIPPPGGIPAPVDPTEAGAPQTVMIVGSDRRAGDGEPPRSDTIILVRLDGDRRVTAMTSIPRDLLVDVPGVGRDVKINAAYEQGGATGTMGAVKRLLGRDGRPFPIHRVIAVDFAGFRRAVNYVGCVFTDVDRDYFNDVRGPAGYARIDIDPGYQKLCGADALAYVRYRHGDSDLYRGARQQAFLRQLRDQPGVDRLMSFDPGNLRELAQVFRRYFKTDDRLRETAELFRFTKAVMVAAGKPVRQVPFRAVAAPGDPNSLVASRAMLDRTVRALLEDPPPAGRPARRSPGRRKPSAAGLVDLRRAGEDQAILSRPEASPPLRSAAGDLGFPLAFPALATRTARYEASRTYRVAGHDAYRLVLATGLVGEYYGVQGTAWHDPPILDDEHETVVRGGRELLVYRDGGRVRLVAWRTRAAVYWVANTLTNRLTERQMLGIAASLKRLGSR